MCGVVALDVAAVVAGAQVFVPNSCFAPVMS
jgi:hypothetical protein